MKNKRLLMVISIVLAVFLLSSCGKKEAPTEEPAKTEEKAETQEEKSEAKTEEKEANFEMPKVAALKGPTSMGMVKLFEDSDKFTIVSAPDEVVAGLTSGEFDLAAIPGNLASVLFNKTEGKIKVLGINTLGTLYMVSTDANIKFIPDLMGMKIVTAGQGATPEYVLKYLLERNGLKEEDVEIEFKQNHQEVLLSAGEENTVLMLPQPFETIALTKDKTLIENINLDTEYKKATQGTPMVMGVIVARAEYLAEHEDDVKAFMEKYKESVNFVHENPKEAAELIEKYEIAPAQVAEAAIPKSNIVLITGNEMRTYLKGFLSVLYKADPKSVGGQEPSEDFYYTAN